MSSFPSSSSLSFPSNSTTSHILSFPHSPSTPVNQLFTRKELVGKGAYGGVYKGIHNPTGTVVALKVIDLDTPDDDISEIQKEVALLSELRDAARHNITLYHGSYLQGYELWIAMDFASGGSIRTLMKSGPIEEKYAALIVREVLVALSFLHRQDIIHRDVKAANILLTQTGKILLCDFGVAAHLQTNSKRSTFTGTPLWMAPEVITDGKLYDTKADIWSLGITLYEIIVGNPPHFGMEPLRACAIIPRSQPPTLPSSLTEGGGNGEGGASTAMREFLANCLMVDPTDRPTADELSKTKWIKSASKLPMVLLRELIVRYVSWIQSGGQRTSIVGTLPGMEGGGDLVQREDTFELTGEREEGWDFEVEEEDFGVQLGLGRSEGLGDEPSYGKVRTLDEIAAKGNLRPPKIPQQPTRNHPLLRLFDEESNPYAQPSPSSSSLASSSSNPLISLPSSSLNTLKPTISLPSFDSLDTDNDDGGINLPSFSIDSSSGGGFGGGSSGAGWGGAGWGNASSSSGGATGGMNDAFGGSGSSPFDTVGPRSSLGPFGGGGGGGDELLMTPTTVRSNPFNDSQGSFGNGGGTSWDQQRMGGGGGAMDGFGEEMSTSNSGGPFSFGGTGAEGEDQSGANFEAEDTWGRNRNANGGPGAGGGGGLTSGFKFGGASSSISTPTFDSSSSSTPTASSFDPQEIEPPSMNDSDYPTRSNFTSSTTGSSIDSSTSFSSTNTLEIAPSKPLSSNRRRADTAPSSRPPPSASTDSISSPISGGGGDGGYPPLGAGLPRTSSNVGGNGGYPPLGVGLPRTVQEMDEVRQGGSEGEGMNRPFGGGAGTGSRPFQFGGSQQRERAATMLNTPTPTPSTTASGGDGNRPFRFGGGATQAVPGIGERKRSGSDGRRQGLSVMTSIPQSNPPSTMITSPSPSSTLTSQNPGPLLHKRQASSLSIRSYNASSPTADPQRPHHRSRSSTSASSSSSSTSTSTILLTASPTSSLSLSTVSSPSNSLTSLPSTQSLLQTPIPPRRDDSIIANEMDQPTPLAQPPSSDSLTNTAIGFPFPSVSTPSLLLPTTTTTNTSQTQPQPSSSSFQLPKIPPLDYSLLSSQSSVERELEKVLEGLGEWFGIVREGLERVLEDDGNDHSWQYDDDDDKGEEGDGEGEDEGEEREREWIVGMDLREFEMGGGRRGGVSAGGGATESLEVR